MVEHNLNNETKYTQGSFKFATDENSIYSMPEKPSSSPQQMDYL